MFNNKKQKLSIFFAVAVCTGFLSGCFDPAWDKINKACMTKLSMKGDAEKNCACFTNDLKSSMTKKELSSVADILSSSDKREILMLLSNGKVVDERLSKMVMQSKMACGG